MPDRPTSSFSRSMAAALRGYLRERDINQSTLADRIDRSEGFVSARLTGNKPLDTDMIDAAAALGGISTQRLYKELGRRLSNPTPQETPSATADRIVGQARADAGDPGDGGEVVKPPRDRRRGA